jgi:hypothetical protein
MMESTLIGGLMPNDKAVLTTSTQSWIALPGAVLDLNMPTSGLASNRVAEDGTVFWRGFANNTYNQLVRCFLPPASFYTSAAQIQSGVLTAALVPVVGRQLAPATGDWRLTNGLVRIQSSATSNGLLCNWFNGTTWGATKDLTLVGSNAATIAEDPNPIRILRNSPEEVVVRITFHNTAANNVYGPIYLDVRLRRGARVIRCYLTTLSSDLWQLRVPGGPASTALTAGSKQTTADGDGNRLVMMNANAATFPNPMVPGIQQSSSGFAFDFGIGMEVGATTNPDLAQDLVFQYLAGQAERMMVVVR